MLIKKIVTPTSGAAQTTDYLFGFQYLNGDLQFFPHAEGYVKPNGTNSYLYVYQYKDHLGNVRLSYADVDGNGSINPATEILEENNYYPFGLKHKGYNEIANSNRSEAAERYKFNGMEWQPELGLDLYDFGARNYDPALGRWLNVDPLAEDFVGRSPYEYCFNNPIMFIDPTGMGPETDFFDMFGKFVMTIKDGKSDIKIMTNRYQLISPSQMKPTQGSNSALINIAKHYRNEMKISNKYLFGVAPNENGKKSSENPAFTGGNDNVVYFNNRGGYSTYLDNTNSFKSVIRHEHKHQKDNENIDHIDNVVTHAQVYLYQMKYQEFKDSTIEFQASMVSSFWNYLYNVQEKKYGTNAIYELIDSFNSLNNGFHFDVGGRGTKVQDFELFYNGNKMSKGDEFKKNDEN